MCYRQMSSRYWHFLGDVLHAMIPCEDIAFPTGMANPGNRNRCRITPDWIVKVQLLRLNLSVLNSCGIPVVYASTLGQISKNHVEKRLRLLMSFILGVYFGTNTRAKLSWKC